MPSGEGLVGTNTTRLASEDVGGKLKPNDLYDTSWLTTAQDGLEWDFSDFVSSRPKQPIRPTTPIVTTTTTKPTPVGQTTHATEAHNQDEGDTDDDEEDDGDTLLILSQFSTVESPQHQGNHSKTDQQKQQPSFSRRTPSERTTSLFAALVQADFFSSDTRYS